MDDYTPQGRGALTRRGKDQGTALTADWLVRGLWLGVGFLVKEGRNGITLFAKERRKS
jgi:hypothetical protein